MRKTMTPVVIAVVLILALAIGANAQAVATNFTWVVTKLLTVTDAATFTSNVINTVNQTITITETASAVMAGNFAMGQGDTLTMLGSGVVWYELSRSNN